MGIPLVGRRVLERGALRLMKPTLFLFMSFSSPPLFPTQSQKSSEASAKKPRTDGPDYIPPIPNFFVLHSLTEKALGDMNPFFVDKSIQGLVGTVKKVSKMKSGDLLIETPNSTIAQNLMRVTAFGDIPIEVTPHRSLNSSRGVIVSRDLLNVTEEELKDGLGVQGVTNVKRIMLRREGAQVPSKVLILTFNHPKLPESVKVGYLRCTVRPYIPNPLRCFLCQRYGHSRNVCRGSPICARCATSDHDFEACQLDPVCANCKGAHPAYSRTCPKWQQEKAVQRYRVENSVSYPEARRAIIPSNDRPLYSTVVKKVMVNSDVQTECTIPPLQISPLIPLIPPPVNSPCQQCIQLIPSQSIKPPKQSSNKSKSTETPRAPTSGAQLRRTPTQQPPLPPARTGDAREQAHKPATKPIQASTAEPGPASAARGTSPPRQHKHSSVPGPSTAPTEFVPQTNSFSARSSSPDSGEMETDPFVSADERMEVEGRGNSPKKKSSSARKKDRARVLPPEP